MTLCFVVFRSPSFRKAFNQLGNLRALTKTPILALTATAPPTIMEEIKASLLLQAPTIVQHDLNQPNIYLSVGKRWSVSVSEKVLLYNELHV